MKEAFTEVLEQLPDFLRVGNTIIMGDSSYYIEGDTMVEKNPRGRLCYTTTEGTCAVLADFVVGLDLTARHKALQNAVNTKEKIFKIHALQSEIEPWLEAVRNCQLRMQIVPSHIAFLEWDKDEHIVHQISGTWQKGFSEISSQRATQKLQRCIEGNPGRNSLEILHLPDSLDTEPSPPNKKL